MAQRYTVGDIDIRPGERRVLVVGEPAAVGARAFDLLLCLIEHRDRVVGKDELMAAVWPGTVVEDSNLTVHVSALRKLLGAAALATVPGRGYRFAAPVVEHAALEDAVRAMAVGIAAVAPGDAALALPDKPSVAVLPFVNLGGDTAQDGFIDGVTEDIITELSRFASLFVIARNSSFGFRGSDVDLRRVAAELGVRYVVEGSIRYADGRIRVTAQLVDAATRTQRWAERYDRVQGDIFALQAELTQAIVAAIAPQIDAVECQRVRGGSERRLGAYELAIRARDLARRADREADAAGQFEALRLADAALAYDADCATALQTIAFVHWQQVWARGSAAAATSVEAGLAAARRAIAIDAGDHLAHLWKGMLLLYSGQGAAGLADLRRAHELNPNDALSLSLLGHFEAGAGDAAAGIAHIGDALRLSPRDGLRWSFLNSLSWARFAAGDHLGATEAALRSIGEAPRFFPPQVCLVLGRAGSGAIAQARADFAALQALAPQAVAARLAGHWVGAEAALARRATALLRIAAGWSAAE